jgi:MarR-like DNA-binding transcriptional regulator SgrR of sgrS sRNA
MSYEEFKEFHDKHPDLDNAEYYAEFPETNKSTVRSWKSKAAKPIIDTPAPTEQEANASNVGYDQEMIKLLATQTNTKLSELEGLDDKSAIIVLKNKMRNLQAQEPEKPLLMPRYYHSPIP